MYPLDLVKLPALMELSAGRPEVVVGLVDGPVASNHPDLADGPSRKVAVTGGGSCVQAASAACRHGTFVAGILFAKRDSVAPAICPGCTPLVQPIFAESTGANGQLPGPKPRELAQAILACIDAGARSKYQRCAGATILLRESKT